MKDKPVPEFLTLLYNIKYLRLKHGLSKREMAKIMRIGMKNLNRIENGEMPRNLGARAIVGIIFRFHVSAKDLFEHRLDT